MENTKKTDELFGADLQGIFGSRYTDETVDAAKEAPAKPVMKIKPVAPAEGPDRYDDPMAGNDAVVEAWLPKKLTRTDVERVVAAAKWLCTFGALSCLFFYWQQTGLMDPAAAVPSMCTCTLVAGWGVGKNVRK